MSRRSCALLALFAGSIFLASQPAPAAAESTAATGQVWLVSTRGATGCGDLEAGLSQITWSLLDESAGCGQWRNSDAAAFQQSARPDVPTTFFVHGYGTDDEWAVRHGWALYNLMKQQACGRVFRLVIWTWPANHEGHYRPDVQMKICRSDVDAWYLARVLGQLPGGAPLCLEGYSLGARIASGALELLAGGSVAGRGVGADTLTAWSHAGPRPIRVMLLGPAMDADWLEPGAPRGMAPLAVERILVATDPSDRVLKLYSRIYCRHGPEALGHCGPAGTAGGKLEVVDVSCEVGRKHDFDLYQESSAVQQRLAWYTFLCAPPAAAAKTAAKTAEKSAEKSALAANNRPAP